MKNKKIVLYVVEDAEVAQFRYRVKNVIEALKESTDWTAKWVSTDEFEEKDLGNVDFVVVLRQSGKDGKILKIIESARKKGVKILFDLDDLIFDFKDLPVLMSATNSRNIFYWMGYVWGIRRVAKKVDGFITTNEFLAGKLKRSFGKACAVIPNSLNMEQVEISEKLIREKSSGDDFVIGYFSGSPTHKKDFAMAEPELIKFLKMHENVKLRVVGYMELSDEMKSLVDNGKVQVLKLMDYLELEKSISEVDVNIAPLLINDFTNCKSELKFFEAAVVETMTIASPTYTFRRAISDGENGFLAQPGEWCGKLEFLYSHPEVNEALAKKAREYVIKNYYGREFLKKIEMVFARF